jgi:hypothetical protein
MLNVILSFHMGYLYKFFHVKERFGEVQYRQRGPGHLDERGV